MKLVPKVLLMLLTATAGSVGTYAAYEIQRQEAELLKDAELANSSVLAGILPGLSKSMWNMDRELVRTTMASLFEHGAVAQVVTYDESGKCFLMLRSAPSGEKGHADEAECERNFGESTGKRLEGSVTPFHDSALKLIAPVENRGEYQQRLIASMWDEDDANNTRKFVGHVVMDYSTAYVRERVTQMQMRIVAFASLLAAVILVIMFFFLRLSVIVHIQNLTRAATAIAGGRFERTREKDTQDEMGVLTRYFNTMVGKLEGEVEHLRLVGEEGLAISSAITFSSLAQQVKRSLARVLGPASSAELFISHTIFLRSDIEPGFYSVTSESEVDASLRFDAVPSDSCTFDVKNPHGRDSFGFVRVKCYSCADPSVNQIIRALLVNVANALSNIRFVEEQREQQKMLADMETTSFVQRSLIPQCSDIRFETFEISSFFKPAATCGGDWWNYFPLPDGRLLLLLGDVTGHGISSAFITAVVKGYCDSIYRTDRNDVSQIMRELNVLVSTCSHGHFLMTMFGLVIDPEAKTISYCNAAHTAPFHYTNVDLQFKGRMNRLLQIGPRLGFDPEFSRQATASNLDHFPVRVIPYETGDTVLVFSDGLIECENDQGEQYSEKRLRLLLENQLSSGASLTQTRDAIVRGFEEFAGKDGQHDDVTFFLLRLHEESVAGKEFQPTMARLFQKGDVTS